MKVYTITSADGQTRASFVPEKGGAGSSIIMPYQGQERELLFLHDHFWDKDNPTFPGGWPFLFPICGRLERMGKAGDYLYDGDVYNLPLHGFAYLMPWQVVHETSASLTMELTDNKDTLAVYPFAFKVRLTYKVINGKLICEQTYTNTGTKPMPYYAGFHPYFITPPAQAGKEKVMLDFKQLRHFRYNERITDLQGEQQLFDLPISAADPKIIEQLVEVPADNVVHLHFVDDFNLYMQAKGDKDAQMFRYIHLYTDASQPYICIEPIMGFPNALNTAYGSRWLLPNQSEAGIVELYI